MYFLEDWVIFLSELKRGFLKYDPRDYFHMVIHTHTLWRISPRLGRRFKAEIVFR